MNIIKYLPFIPLELGAVGLAIFGWYAQRLRWNGKQEYPFGMKRKTAYACMSASIVLLVVGIVWIIVTT